MLSREEALRILDEAYAARVRGDKDALARYWAEGASFEIAGEPTLMNGVPHTAASPMKAISELMDRFQFSALRRLDALVDGNRVAVRWEVTISAAGRPNATTQLFDLITFNEAGKIESFVQFADTALVRHLAG